MRVVTFVGAKRQKKAHQPSAFPKNDLLCYYRIRFLHIPNQSTFPNQEETKTSMTLYFMIYLYV